MVSLSKLDPPAGKKGLGKIQFAAQKDEIEKALKKGWSAKDIWQHLSDEGVITIQYCHFALYVREQIKGIKPTITPPSSDPQTEVQEPASSDNHEQIKKPRKPIKVTTTKTSKTVRPRLAKDVDDSELY